MKYRTIMSSITINGFGAMSTISVLVIGLKTDNGKIINPHFLDDDKLEC